HYVATLEVRMYDPHIVRCLKALGHLDREWESLLPRKAMDTPDPGGKRLSAEQLHGEEEQRRTTSSPVMIYADLEHAANVRMGHLAGELNFLLEPPHVDFIRGKICAHRLE